MNCSVCCCELGGQYYVIRGKKSCSSTKCLSRLYIEASESLEAGERYKIALTLTTLRQRKIRAMRNLAFA